MSPFPPKFPLRLDAIQDKEVQVEEEIGEVEDDLALRYSALGYHVAEDTRIIEEMPPTFAALDVEGHEWGVKERRDKVAAED